MAIERVNEKCIGCGTCVKSCPQDVFRMIENKAVVRYPEECTMCMICVADCPADAIDGTKGKPWMTSGY